MNELTQLLPSPRQVLPSDIVAQVAQARREPLGLEAPAALAFCTALSERLLYDPRATPFPSLQALGFWLRPASIKTMLQEHLGGPRDCTRVPRGVVFQISPSNIETLFGYNCLLSLLCGNVTIVRLPSASTPEQETLLNFMTEIYAGMPPALVQRLILLRYEHEAAITEKLSALCDMRMVWGGDATITAIRQIPLPPLAHEISFANRFSMAAIKAQQYLAQTDEAQAALARGLVGDVFQFGQMACASPRLLCWIGSEADTKEAAALLHPQLAAFALEKYGTPEIGANLAKLNAQFLGLHDLEINSTVTYNPALTVLSLQSWRGVADFKTLNFGHGLLLETRFESLQNLAAHTESLDQTLVASGFEVHEIDAFVTLCSGRGFDRIVRAGRALDFDPIWDGTNLFDALTKFVKVSL